MIIDDVVQGSEEWFKKRAGIPTSSNFDKLVTVKGEPLKQRQKYMYQLAAERITGVKEESFQSIAMQKGLEREEEARNMYEFITGCDIEQVGICYPNKKKLYGCSPDGLVGKDGVLEIKCPTAAVHVGYLLKGTLPLDYFQQLQGQLLVTGRKWVDFFSFYPALKPLLIRVKPEKSFVGTLQTELEAFCKELDEITRKLKNA